jgi:hypothetical protein
MKNLTPWTIVYVNGRRLSEGTYTDEVWASDAKDAFCTFSNKIGRSCDGDVFVTCIVDGPKSLVHYVHGSPEVSDKFTQKINAKRCR